ncbi:amidohydrolase family protein [Hymenobacter koreensis]|uniref:amidohydrolase family protein n=1 Tax=Hymenobacter koreensis TaxID=1084523 RepID=UPI0031E6E222
MTAIKAGRLFDSERGIVLTNQIIIIRGNSITAVGKGIAIPPGATVLDLSQYTVLPGLIEAHSHLLMEHPGDEDNTLTVTKAVTMEGDALRALRGAARAQSYLDAGYTTVRDLGNSGVYADVALKRAIDEGTLPGPRLYVSGPGLAPEGGQVPGLMPGQTQLITGDYRIIRGVEDARLAVREHVYHGVDLIKIYSNSSPNKTYLSVPEMHAIVEEAHLHQLKVTAHATTDLAIRRALQAGVDGIEHGYVVADSTLRRMRRQHVILVPTDMDFQLAQRQVDKLRMNLSAEQVRTLAKPYHDRLLRARQAGTTIAAGSDMYMGLGLSRGQAAKRLLFAYAEAGLPLADILRAATWNGALLLAEPRLGRLQAGAWADIIAVKGNPLESLSSLEGVAFVMKAGVVIKPAP